MGGRAFRTPSVYEQFYTDGITQLPAVDPARGLELRPESIITGEVEYSQRFAQDWVVLGAVHASRISDVIHTIQDPSRPAFVRYANNISAITLGADAEIRRDWRRGWMLGASYGYEVARSLDSSAANPRLVNAPEHLASLRGVVPVVERLVSAGLKMTLEAPRRLSLESDALTRAAVVADLALSGEIHRFHTRYVLGLYNVMDARYDYPVSDTFLARSSRQNGRTLLVDVIVSTP
jgi:outer membrane receptor for ferrienterochelin and colicins